MLTLHRAILATSLVALGAAPVFAQSEDALKDAFEGKSIVVKIDMPGTQQGVDVYPDARRPIDMGQYAARIKTFGIALRNGESAMITRVRVKDKLIEFQLGGGGYGTFGDDTGTVTVPSVPKSQREKDLERRVKDERDSDRRRRLQRELDDLRNERYREDTRNRSRAAEATEVKKDRIAADRLHSGSRFNIRYQNGVPPGLDAGGIMRALQDYVDFPFASDRPVRRDHPAPPPPSAGGDIRKGMARADVESILGRPDKTTPRTEGSVRVVTATYTRGDQIITVDFIEGVVVKYAISSK
jgi:hypothetical protein